MAATDWPCADLHRELSKGVSLDRLPEARSEHVRLTGWTASDCEMERAWDHLREFGPRDVDATHDGIACLARGSCEAQQLV